MPSDSRELIAAIDKLVPPPSVADVNLADERVRLQLSRAAGKREIVDALITWSKRK